ncbi:MAG TPA: multiple monosaccharide ABC transporter permease [Cryobacterium sp.]|nr:multiple monosaccharide ABC transporter permease [Cryobacterium sp.]
MSTQTTGAPELPANARQRSSAPKVGLKALATKNIRQSGIAIAFVAIIGLFSILTGGLLLSPGNLTNIVLQYSYVLILSIGMLIVIVAGHIDLSVGSLLGLAGAVSAFLVIKEGMPWWTGMLAAIAVGLIAGAWQGFWVERVGIPAFIVTLAGMLIFRGLTFLVLNNISLSPFPSQYQKVASGFLNGLLGGPGYDVFTLLVFALAVAGYAVSLWRGRAAKIEYNQPVESVGLFITKIAVIAVVVMAFAWQLAHARGLPIVLILLAVLIIVYTLVTNKTTFGRHVYAMGGNLKAAQLSGVRVKKVNFWIFVNNGFLVALAGIVYSSRSNGAQPAAGNGFELDAIAACFIGGAAVTGGIGTVGGAMIGGLIMGTMSNGMQLMGIESSIQQVVRGLVLLLAVAFDVWNKRRAVGG